MSKKTAILQSNYIPWKGYFDLINMVDEFIFYDEVQYTKNLDDELKEHLNYNGLKKQDNITIQGSLDEVSGHIFVKRKEINA